MRNKLFWALAIVAVVVVGALVWAAASTLEAYGISDPLAAVCMIAFLIVAFVAWEVLMKPGYGILSRSQRREDEGTEETEEPPSSGAT